MRPQRGWGGGGYRTRAEIASFLPGNSSYFEFYPEKHHDAVMRCKIRVLAAAGSSEEGEAQCGMNMRFTETTFPLRQEVWGQLQNQ